MIWLQNDMASNLAGSISIACWIVVLVPQLWTNYKRQSGDSLSITFLIIWLLGDLLNLAGALLQDLLPTMIVLAFYYNLTDIILLVQVFYYRLGRDASAEEEIVMITEETPLVRPRKSSQSEQISRSPMSYTLEIMAGILCVCLTGAVAYYFSNEEQGMNFEDDLSGTINQYVVMNRFYWVTGNALGPAPPSYVALLGQTLGWGSAVLYLGSRIPQIIKNFKNRSCEGLSIIMFCFSVLGNATYCLSILFHSIEPEFILIHLPWLLGSGGTLLFDFMIFSQFYIYRDNKNGALAFTSSANSVDDNESMKQLSENIV